MNTKLPSLTLLAAAGLLAAVLAAPAPVVLAQAGCGAAAASAAASMGGQVVGAPQIVNQGGRTMCVVTVLIHDPSGQRPPERRQVTVPAG